MPASWTYGRLVGAGVVVCLVSALLMPQVPYLALFACALVLTEMSLRGRSRQAAFMAGASAAAAGILWGPGGAVLTAIGLIGLLAAIASTGRVGPWKMLMALATAYAVSFLAVDAAQAWLSGQSFIEQVRQSASAAAGAVTSSATAVGGATVIADSETIAQTLFGLWPASYAVTGLITAAMVMAGVSRVSRLHGARRAMPTLDKTDLSPHILWLPVVGVSMLVVAELAGASGAVLRTLGGNMLVIAWPLLAWQGLAVVSGGLTRFEFPLGGRLLVYACMFVMETLFFAVSLLGFVDIVANFRRLERADVSRQDGAGDPASSS